VNAYSWLLLYGGWQHECLNTEYTCCGGGAACFIFHLIIQTQGLLP